MFYTIKKFFSLSKIEKVFLIEAFFISIFVKVLLLLFSYKFIEKHIINKNFKKKTKNTKVEETIFLIKKSIQRVSRYVFWKNLCIEQSLVALIMLKKRNISHTLYMGVSKFGSKIIAHAWIQSNSIFIVEKGNTEFIVLKEYNG